MADPLSALPHRPEKRIAGGGFAEIYTARGAKDPVILKVARLETQFDEGATGALYLSRALQFGTGAIGSWPVDPSELLKIEGATLKKVTQPAFVKLLGEGEIKDTKPRAYLVLERVMGRTWREALGSGSPPTLAHVKELVEALVDARDKKQLEYHGDLKPENLLLDVKDNVRIIDPTSGATKLGPNQQPERLVTTGAYNPLLVASDIPALGLLIVEIATGRQVLALASEARPPHAVGPKLAQSLAAMAATGLDRFYRRILFMELPRELRPDMPEELEAMALGCLGLTREGKGLESAPLPDLTAVLAVLQKHASLAPPTAQKKPAGAGAATPASASTPAPARDLGATSKRLELRRPERKL